MERRASGASVASSRRSSIGGARGRPELDALDSESQLALASSIAWSSWLRFKGGFLKGWTMYYCVLSRTNQLTAYTSDDYQGKPWKFRVQAMMVQPNRSIQFGFVVTTLKDGAITFAATNGKEYRQWINALSEKHPTRPSFGRDGQQSEPAPRERSLPVMERSQSTEIESQTSKEVFLYVPTTVIPLHGNSGVLKKAREEIATLQSHFGEVVPYRGNLDDPSIEWRIGRPEYAVLDLAFLQGKKHNHSPQSIEWMVQNLIKRWELEVSHKANINQWTTIHPEHFSLQVNMGPSTSAAELHQQGKYNSFLSQCPRHVYDSANSSRERSYLSFSSAFPDGFAWEVLQVFTGLPKVSFSWRHWGHCAKEKKADSEGDLVELTGFAIVEVDATMRIHGMELFFKPEPFLEELRKHNFSEVSTRPRRASAPNIGHESSSTSVSGRRHTARSERPASGSVDSLDDFLRCPFGITEPAISQSVQNVHAHTRAG